MAHKRRPRQDKATPKGPETLHAPWRDTYMQELSASAAPSHEDGPSFFCAYWASPASDEKNHVVARIGQGDTAGMILLNKYPYANGHLLVALADARPRLTDYAPEQRTALWRLVDLACALAERTLEPQGLNIGVNQGVAAGAGVPGHLHAHVVPRWHGDVNFITAVGQLRVIPSSLDQMAHRYRAVWAQMASESS